jgi:lipopolysaccharide/colanic/teichoic acid biosynthesis glycosyltransferase
VALIGIVALSPALLCVAVLILLSDGTPVVYRARRVGQNGQGFDLLKFRTMTVGADRNGVGLTIRDDRRVTRIGRWLRRFKVDELPQLINVLKGEMSFVGPRPEDPRFVALYSREQRRILSHRPGITSPASLQFRDEASLLSGCDSDRQYVETILPQKLSIDMEYCDRRSTFTDLQVIFRTLGGLWR